MKNQEELMSIMTDAEKRLLQQGHNHSDDDWGELMDDEIYRIASERKTEII